MEFREGCLRVEPQSRRIPHATRQTVAYHHPATLARI